MFCSNCGNNVLDGVLFCSKCGARMGNGVNSVPEQSQVGGMSLQALISPLGATTANKGLIYYIGIVISQIFVLIGWFGEGVTAKASFFGETIRENGTICDMVDGTDLGFMNVLIVIACLLAVVPVALTLVTKSEKLMLAPLIYLAVLVMAIGYIIVFVAMGEANYQAMGLGSVGFNFWGILSIVAVVATAVLPAIAKSKSN